MPKLRPKSISSVAGTKTVPLIAPAPAAGDQIVRGGLTTGRAGQAVAYANKWRENYNPMRGLTMLRAVALLESAQRGDTALLQWTYCFIEQMNSTLSGLISRCEAPLANFDWQIKTKAVKPPGMGDTQFQAAAEKQKETLEAAYNQIDNLREAILHLHLAEFRGYAHLQKHRNEQGDVLHLEPLNQYCVCRDGLFGDWFWNPDSKFTSDPAHFLGEAFRIAGAELPLADFLIHECPRPINRIGLIHTIRHALANKDWDGFLEIYGIPGGIVIMPPNVPPGREGDYETAAMRAAEGAPAALPNGSDFRANESPRGVDPFSPRLKALDEQLILAGTGGKLTMLAESGSGTLAGGAHEDTFSDISAGRCKKISERFQRDFDAEVLAAKHPGEPHLVYFDFGPEESEDINAIFQNAVLASQAGKNVATDWLEEKTGYQLEDAPKPPAGPAFAGKNEPVSRFENRAPAPASPENEVVAGIQKLLLPLLEKQLAASLSGQKIQNRRRGNRLLNGDVMGHSFHGNQYVELADEHWAGSVKEMRQKANDIMKGFPPATHPVLGEVRFSKQGRGKTLGHKVTPHEFQSVQALPQLIAKGRIISSEPDRQGRPKIAAVQKLEHGLKIGGTKYRAQVTIRSTREGKAVAHNFYLHRIDHEK